MKENTFLGTGWAFPPEFDKLTKENAMVSDEEDIKESLYILISTSPGERVMNPSYGCDIKSRVFDTVTQGMLTVLKDSLTKSILFFETRIKLNFIDIDTSDMTDGVLYITIDYTVRTTNNRSNMVYPYYFIEGTNVGI